MPLRKSQQYDLASLILRAVFGGLMLSHGFPKLMKFFGDEPLEFADPIGIGEVPSLVLTVMAEVGCSLLVVIGLKTKWAVTPLVVTMCVAAFVVHGSHELHDKEMALLYLGGYAAIFMLGSGKYSIDGLIARR
ncbi:MAG: DoxX family protein [Flavobacteriales bacterium]|nr:DoxX family protein [Flavobacteriales bacterium]